MALGKMIGFTPCQWSSISRELTWKNMALRGKECPISVMIEEAIKNYSPLDHSARVAIDFEEDQSDLLKRTIAEMMEGLGPLADEFGLKKQYSLP
jgi:hypothetical protein